MKSLENTQLTNPEINALAMEYKATRDEAVFNKLMSAVKDLAEHLAYKFYNNSRGLNVPEDDFVQEAYLAVYSSIDSYDVEKGSYFTAHLKRCVEWKIQDNIIKANQRKSQQFNRQALSLDASINSGTDSFLSAVEHQYATDTEEVFNTAVENVESNDTPDVFSLAKELITDFSQDASEDDKTIIETTFSVILTASHESGDIKRKITKALTDTLGVAPATARKKKSRAFARFEAFASERNFEISLSQF
ncbi:sigma factor [Bacillus paralicheniformis]|uniref:sigma factor n=1 Tax=Bacillus TaxID=1386 RepID=UPI001CC62F3E|nr:sigma factor [Bacillus paralicheniformis]UAY71984.1 hypothetical protein K8336_08075 [Bacillus paralicheniformis]